MSVRHPRSRKKARAKSTAREHNKQVIGYITQWDGWKEVPGLVPKGGYTQINVDYSQYTILNYSFFGVAKDGSLLSGDYKNKNIWKPGEVQEPAPLIHPIATDSYDKFITLGALTLVSWINPGDYASSLGYQMNASQNGWIHPESGEEGIWPLALPRQGGSPYKGLIDGAHEHGCKVMAAIGGWSMCKHYPEMAKDPVKRARFLTDCEKLMGMRFDGIDFDWEYPNNRGMNIENFGPEDYANFASLAEEVRRVIGPNKLITSCYSAVPAVIEGFDWTRLNATIDFFNMMTYDYNGGWSNKANHNSPLYDYPGAEYPGLSLNDTVQYLKTTAINLAKVNLGAAFYGRGLVTQGAADLNAATVKSPAMLDPDGPVETCADFVNWPLLLWDGTPPYSAILQKTGADSADGLGWTYHWDDNAKVPYKTKDNYFLSYDNERSIEEKAKYVVDQGLAGIIVWQVYQDLVDMTSGAIRVSSDGTEVHYCPQTRSPLVNKINEVFADGPIGPRPPQVTITSPKNNDSFVVGSDIVIEAQASAPSGTITKVEFWSDEAGKLGDGTSAGSGLYRFTYPNATEGVYHFYAKAFDSLSQSATSATVRVTVNEEANQPPTIRITSPSEGASFEEHSNITITAEAEDDRKVAKVEFFAGTDKLHEFHDAPYTWTWPNVPGGSYELIAKATDDMGESSSAKVRITVEGAQPEPPTIEIVSPENQEEFEAPAMVVITAEVSHDPNTTIDRVVFYKNGNFLAEDTSDPFRYEWNNVSAGDYVLTAEAIDKQGSSATSDPVSITVVPQGGGGDCSEYAPWDPNKVYDTWGEMVGHKGKVYSHYMWSQGVEPRPLNPGEQQWEFEWKYEKDCGGGPDPEPKPPTVTILSPSSGASFTAPASIPFTIQAAPATRSISKVELYNGTQLIGQAQAPAGSNLYTYTWTGVPAGSYTVKAKATDAQGLTGESQLVTITVTSGGGQPPTVTIVSPTNGTSFTAPADFIVNAQAVASSGGVAKVEFFNGSQKLGEATQPGGRYYQYVFGGAPAGIYSLKARVTDTQGRTGESQVVTVTVTSSGGGGGIGDLISREDWDWLFPARNGPSALCPGDDPNLDFFSYDNFVEAARFIGNFKVMTERRCATGAYRLTRIDKTTGEEMVFRQDADFLNSTNAIVTEVVDFGDFCNSGTLEVRKRELAAFLANISQETNGVLPEHPNASGLYWKEEVRYKCNQYSDDYRDPINADYPPVDGASYHGRGPLQLSWNTNYGQCSALFYGDKNILLNNPELVLASGVTAFQAAIWFWMTPQYPKPSCHQVMLPTWQPTPEQSAVGIKPGFGATPNIINPGYECGSGGAEEQYQVKNRLGYYQRYAQRFGVSLELGGGNNPANCGCKDMKQFQVDSQECSKIASLKFISPGSVVMVEGPTPIKLKVQKQDPQSEITGVTITVDGQQFNGLEADWTPTRYGKFTATAVGTRTGKDPVRGTVDFVVWNTATSEGCSEIPLWDSEKEYPGDRGAWVVRYLGKVWENKWWANPGEAPGSADSWHELGNCSSRAKYRSSGRSRANIGKRQG